MAEKTLVIYKPDAVRRNIIGEITTLFQDRGLKMVGAKLAGIQENSGKSFTLSTKVRISSSVWLTTCPAAHFHKLFGQEMTLIRVGRQLAGATDPLQADPGSIRGRYGLPCP